MKTKRIDVPHRRGWVTHCPRALRNTSLPSGEGWGGALRFRKKSATTGNDMHRNRERNDRTNRIHYTFKVIVFKY